jgi:hypothetical protein
MKKISKRTLGIWFFAGIWYALGMAGYDYLDGDEFNIWKFLINFIGFGLIMSLLIRFPDKKSSRKY